MSARPEEIRRIAEEIAEVPQGLILVHGAGSFGHVPAKEYGLPQRFSPEGLRITHRSVSSLNDLVVDALSKAGADSMPVHPLSCATLRDGRVDSFAVQPLVEMVKDGLIPVLHGDVAMDASRKAGIVSGDQLVSYLAEAMKAEVVAVGTDVDGIIFQGRPLQRITKDRMASIEEAIGGSAGVDVTGGMKGKLQELLNLADMGTSSVIFNAGKKGNIARALRGEAVGTAVVGSTASGTAGGGLK
jgi:isopentenyl phosphate kinase